jgi:hypothetical protein
MHKSPPEYRLLLQNITKELARKIPLGIACQCKVPRIPKILLFDPLVLFVPHAVHVLKELKVKDLVPAWLVRLKELKQPCLQNLVQVCASKPIGQAEQFKRPIVRTHPCCFDLERIAQPQRRLRGVQENQQIVENVWWTVAAQTQIDHHLGRPRVNGTHQRLIATSTLAADPLTVGWRSFRLPSQSAPRAMPQLAKRWPELTLCFDEDGEVGAALHEQGALAEPDVAPPSEEDDIEAGRIPEQTVGG